MGRLEFPNTSSFIPVLPHGLNRGSELAGVVCGRAEEVGEKTAAATARFLS